MEGSQQQLCSICLQHQNELIVLSTCKHIFCAFCIKKYIDTLKNYNLLTPQKLICLHHSCSQELPDQIIQKIYPGDQGIIMAVVRKRYKQSKDPSIKIFNCKGFTKSNHQPLVQKPSVMTRDLHSKLMNQKVSNILTGKQKVDDKKNCTNILSFNKLNTKQKTLQCYVCGVFYCTRCENLGHEGKCQINSPEEQLARFTKKALQSKVDSGSEIEKFLEANEMAKCVNPKCGIAIAKEEGCFWVKCRCSWQFCYPCKKVWGDCQHYSKYPYQKFVPPPDWMVKALNLY